MSIKDKKNEVLDLLKKTNDSALIEEVYNLLHPDDSEEEISVLQLPENLQQKINKAMEDYKRGNYITHDQMKQKVQQWLIN